MFSCAQQIIRRNLSIAAATWLLLPLLADTPRVFAQVSTTPSVPQTALSTAPSWDKLKAAYDYQPAPADSDYLLQPIAVKDAEGNSIPGLFLRPKPKGVYPVVLLLHGLGSDKELMIRLFGRPLASKGFACLALDAREHGARSPAGQTWNLGSLLAPSRSTQQGGDGAPGQIIPAAGLRFAMVLKGTVVDYRRALDYLHTREDVDTRRVGLLGYSMGAMMGAILAGVDDRVQAVVLEVGGDPIRPMLAGMPELLHEQIETISPSNYVGHIAPRPVLFINAKNDQIMREDAARRLQEAAREPKEIVWAEGGHILAEADAQRGIIWLSEKLNPAPSPQ